MCGRISTLILTFCIGIFALVWKKQSTKKITHNQLTNANESIECEQYEIVFTGQLLIVYRLFDSNSMQNNWRIFITISNSKWIDFNFKIKYYWFDWQNKTHRDASIWAITCDTQKLIDGTYRLFANGSVCRSGCDSLWNRLSVLRTEHICVYVTTISPNDVANVRLLRLHEACKPSHVWCVRPILTTAIAMVLVSAWCACIWPAVATTTKPKRIFNAKNFQAAQSPQFR